jgi:hypothetical protein
MQLGLFDSPAAAVSFEDVLLYALGEFQARGHRLADRELALDRLHGAFTRASQKFGIGEPSDEMIADLLQSLGANVTKLPKFVAKRPYRIVISKALSQRASDTWRRVEHA